MTSKTRRNRFPALLVLVLILLLTLVWYGRSELAAQELSAEAAAQGGDDFIMTPVMARQLADTLPAEALPPLAAVPCVGGTAAGYPCDNVNLLAFMPLADIGGTVNPGATDIWGWTDPLDTKEYVVINRNDGTAFVDISDPENPLYLGNLPTNSGQSTWRDVKVYNNHAFIVSDGNGAHGMQIFDLTRLRSVVSPPVTFNADFIYTGINSAHNIVINEESGFAYSVGSSSGGTTCAGGLHMINIQNPTSPTFAGCYSGAYTHDAQCITYAGPDPDYQGSEICATFNGNTGLALVDVTDKGSPDYIVNRTYTGLSYAHQGWFTPDHKYIIHDDELDEWNFGHNTRTRIWDATDLDNPQLIGFFDAPVASIDHNLYVHNGLIFEANYTSGLRILDGSDIPNGNLSQLGYFDVYTANNSPTFNGAWSVYPYFESGVLAVSGREQGLFLLDFPWASLSIDKSQPSGTAAPGQTLTYTITVTNSGNLTATNVVVTDTLNGSSTVLSGPDMLAPGAGALYLFSYVVQPGDCAGLLNTAMVSTDTGNTAVLAQPIFTSVNCGTELFIPLFIEE